MKLIKFGTQLPQPIIDFLNEKSKSGQKIWFIVYEALIEKYHHLKKLCK